MSHQEEIARLWEARSWAALTGDMAELAWLERRLQALGVREAEPAGKVPREAEDHQVGEEVNIHAAPDWF